MVQVNSIKRSWSISERKSIISKSCIVALCYSKTVTTRWQMSVCYSHVLQMLLFCCLTGLDWLTGLVWLSGLVCSDWSLCPSRTVTVRLLAAVYLCTTATFSRCCSLATARASRLLPPSAAVPPTYRDSSPSTSKGKDDQLRIEYWTNFFFRWDLFVLLRRQLDHLL